MQYSNGGFPRRYPLQDNYGRYITINDDAMLGVVSLMKDIADQKPDFTFVTDAQRHRAEGAVSSRRRMLRGLPDPRQRQTHHLVPAAR